MFLNTVKKHMDFDEFGTDITKRRYHEELYDPWGVEFGANFEHSDEPSDIFGSRVGGSRGGRIHQKRSNADRFIPKSIYSVRYSPHRSVKPHKSPPPPPPPKPPFSSPVSPPVEPQHQNPVRTLGSYFESDVESDGESVSDFLVDEDFLVNEEALPNLDDIPDLV